MCPFISAQLYRIPSVNKIEKEWHYVTSIERDELFRQFFKETVRKIAAQHGKLFSELESMQFGGLLGQCTPANQEAARKRADADPKFKAMMSAIRDALSEASAEANRIQQEKGAKLKRDLNIKAAAQNKLAKNLTCISPCANFIYVATDLTGTGLRSLDYSKQIISEYYNMFNSYLGKKEQQAMKDDPTFDNNSFLDISDRPHFVFKEELLRDKFDAVLPYWGILVLFNVIFFVAAFAGFMRYDVR
jgi:hypothetical protein